MLLYCCSVKSAHVLSALCSKIQFLFTCISHKKQKDSLETQAKLDALHTMLRTKLYQNPFFCTVHQSVNKPKNREVQIVYGSIILLYRDANITGSNCAIISCNLSKKHKLVLYQTQGWEPNYVDHKILF